MSRIDVIGQNGNDGEHYDRGEKIVKECIFKKPDGVCSQYKARMHSNMTFQNSQYGWGYRGACMVGSTGVDDSDMCIVYESED